MYDELRKSLLDKFEFWEQGIRDEDVMDLCISDIRDTINDSENFKLYRYVPPEYFNIRNIETQTIHLSPNGVLNDIYEGLMGDNERFDYKEFQELNDLAYMTCLTETNDNLLMWSHYAKGHTGICIEYDLKRLKNDPYKILNHIYPVIYDNDILIKRNIPNIKRDHNILKLSIDNSDVYDGQELFDDIVPLFLIKSEEWSYECEWRIIYSMKQMYDENDETLYKGNIPFNCISGVYLGVKIHPEIRQNIIEICQRLNTTKNPVKVHQAKIGSNRSSVEFEELWKKEGQTK